MQIIFDLDGVIRNLVGLIEKKFHFRVRVWNWSINDKNIYDIVNKNINFLTKAPATEYYRVIKKYFPEPKIWTTQPQNWHLYTKKWLGKYFGTYSVKFFDNYVEKYKELQKLDNTILIEDYPFYPNYDKIILIDRIYNRNINATRIKTPKELKKFIDGVLKNENKT
jgi:hypothetical protein